MKTIGEYLQITTTTGTRKDAERIAAELVSRSLAGCVQVSGPIMSTFRWQGKTETQEEWLCTIKTAKARWAEVHKAIKSLHPYKVPEVIATAIVEGSDEYLAWLSDEVS
jgi:periplasmic divalent cation tolerance protein